MAFSCITTLAFATFFSSFLNLSFAALPSRTEHPLIGQDITPPLLAWYETRHSEEHPERLYANGAYFPRSSKHQLRESGNKVEPTDIDHFNGFDVLAFYVGGQVVEDWLTFEVRRDAKMCVIFGADEYNYGDEVEVDGFEMIGLSHWPDEEEPLKLASETAPYEGESVAYGFIGCKDIAEGVHTLPHKDLFKSSHKFWGYSVLFGEADGTPSKPPAVPEGLPNITANAKCPEELHDLWVVENPDNNADEDVADKKWRSWHPSVDPMYHCYYGHEHGTDPALSGYTARFHYLAWKNDRQDESHTGFKGYGIEKDGINYYINLHAQTSLPARIDQQFHSMVVSATDKESGELMMEIQCKADYGFTMAEVKEECREPFPAVDFKTMSPMNQELAEKAYDVNSYYDRRIRRKRVNVLNTDDIDKCIINELDACNECPQNNETLMRGRYETWTSPGPQMCMNSSQPYQFEGIIIDIKDAGTACLVEDTCLDHDLVQLGRPPNEYLKAFNPNLGLHRDIQFREVTLGEDVCGFDIPERGSDYVF